MCNQVILAVVSHTQICNLTPLCTCGNELLKQSFSRGRESDMVAYFGEVSLRQRLRYLAKSSYIFPIQSYVLLINCHYNPPLELSYDGDLVFALASRLRSESGTGVITQCVSTYRSLNMAAYCCVLDRFQCFQSIFRLCLASSLPHDRCSQDSFLSKPSWYRYCSYKQNQFCGCGLVFGLYSRLRSQSDIERIKPTFATCILSDKVAYCYVLDYLLRSS